MTRLSDMMAIPRGIVAVVGGGGKTTLIWRLAQELKQNARVLIATTTKIRPPACLTLLSPTRAQVMDAFKNESLIAVGDPAPEGKLGPAAGLSDNLKGIADYVLIEADGSRGLPLKAPAAYEPVLPEHAALTVAVAGMSCAGLTVDQAAHRNALYAELSGLRLTDTVTPEAVARALTHSDGQRKNVNGRFMIVLNQTDTPQQLDFARKVAALTREDTWIVALRSRPDWAENWRDGRFENDIAGGNEP